MSELAKKSCRYCRGQIHRNATVCLHCSREQQGWRIWVNQRTITTAITLAGVAVSLMQVNVAKQQAEDATQARIEAQKALETIRSSGAALAKLMVAFEALDERFGSLAVLPQISAIARGQTEQLLEALKLSPNDESGVRELRTLLIEWRELNMVEIEKLTQAQRKRLKEIELRIEQLAR